MSHADTREAFYHQIDRRRRALGLTWQEVCRQAGVSRSVATRLGKDGNVMADSVFKLSAWLQSKGKGGAAASQDAHLLSARSTPFTN